MIALLLICCTLLHFIDASSKSPRQSTSPLKPKGGSSKLTQERDIDKGGSRKVSRPSPMKSQEREQLYEAYNLLHTLAQDFRKPFDSPAVLVVGHQVCE